MTDSMVARVARAIYEKRNGPGCYPWGNRTNSHKAPYLADAHAAIEAMREPTDDMLHAGSQSIFHSDKDWQSNACWRAMIDAALSQAQPTGEKPAQGTRA